MITTRGRQYIEVPPSGGSLEIGNIKGHKVLSCGV